LTDDCDLLVGEDFILMVNLSEGEIEVTARYRGENPPASFEPMGSDLGRVKLDRNAFKITIKPFEPIGVKLVFKHLLPEKK
ncbi:MAG: hypothetical protein FGF53_06540, partial [Candidatus Brockarchaeota archaeon]|nr:hypothetical protein [Candidatus Brockarchaeota archaeon]